MRPASGIRVGDAGRKGRGVFATKLFLPGDTIERAPLIVIGPGDASTLISSIIERYWYEMDDEGTAIGLGFTSLYNHSSRANAVYEAVSSDNTLHIVAHREIKPGTEITINYNGYPNSKAKVDFNYEHPEDPDDESDYESESYPTKVHYLDESEWGQEGWVWCGDCDVKATTAPALVTCTECRLRMLSERSKLLKWDPDSTGVVDHQSLLKMMWHTIQYLSGHGLTIYADVVREAVRTMTKEER